MKSMTAYGRGEYRLGETLFVSEIKAVNHRYQDVVFRLPRNLLMFEKDLKNLVSSRVRRGRIEVFFEMQNLAGAVPYELELNGPLAEAYAKIFHQLAELTGSDRNLPLESLWQMKDVIISKPAEMAPEEVKRGLETALNQALDGLDEMRRREGAAIEADFLERLAILGRYLEEVEQQAPALVESYRKRLKENIDRMLNDVTVDENRLAQEVAFFAEKSDITEEIVRIKSHVVQFRLYLSLDDAVGRKLDFLIQELNREVNTIGSKTADSAVTRVVVEMKAELEKLREQVQNVE